MVPENTHVFKDGHLVSTPSPPGIYILALYMYLLFSNVAIETPTPSEFPVAILGEDMDIFWTRTMHFLYQ